MIERFPSRDDFARAFERGETVLAGARRIDDLLTPVGAFMALGQGRSDVFLLESVEGGAWRADHARTHARRPYSASEGALTPCP